MLRADTPSRLVAERRFYSGMSLLMLVSVLVGFARTYFLSPWFPEMAHMRPPEPFFFYVHGVVFVAWILFAVLQPTLVAKRRVDLHRRIGWIGAGLAVAVVVVGTWGSLMAAARPGGFIGVPVPALRFLTVPLADLALFAAFATLAVVKRRDPQSHKRYMLLATIGLIDAAVVRWPLSDMGVSVGLLFTKTDLLVDLFLVPMVVWDLVSRGRIHRATLIGGLAVIASQPLRVLISETDAWLRFATWAVGLLGR